MNWACQLYNLFDVCFLQLGVLTGSLKFDLKRSMLMYSLIREMGRWLTYTLFNQCCETWNVYTSSGYGFIMYMTDLMPGDLISRGLTIKILPVQWPSTWCVLNSTCSMTVILVCFKFYLINNRELGCVLNSTCSKTVNLGILNSTWSVTIKLMIFKLCSSSQLTSKQRRTLNSS